MQTIDECRGCNTKNLLPILSLGNLAYTGYFPSPNEPIVPTGPLDLAYCSNCSLAQLAHNYSPPELYGQNYGYRSGLNASMVAHLHDIARYIIRRMSPTSTSKILDIGCNDGTLINYFCSTTKAMCYGVDPTISKFGEYIHNNVKVKSDFFSSNTKDFFEVESFDVITSIAMFYDLISPVEFIEGIAKSLSVKGIWVLEQGYAGWMQRTGSFDTICHEHLEYYTLKNVHDLVRKAGLEIVDVNLTEANGGSIMITVAHENTYEVQTSVKWFLNQEEKNSVNSYSAWLSFAKIVHNNIERLQDLLSIGQFGGNQTVGLGASTKGNVLLQVLGLTTREIQMIGEVNEDKFGKITPGTAIPIVSETEIFSSNAKNILVLPWHFKEGIMRKLKDEANFHGKVIFPLPNVEVISV